MTEAKVAVLVLNFNGQKFLEECFNSLKAQTYADAEYWLVDNASSDASVAYAKQIFPWGKVMVLDKNYGFCGAYNRAVDRVKTSFVVFLNNDTVVTEDWLEKLVGAIEKDEKVAAAGSKILFYDRRDTIFSAGLMMTPIGVGYDIGLGKKNSELYSKARYLGGVSGASMIVRRNLFVALGGFDESYFTYGEDVDLCWRLILMGYKVFYEPASIVYHHVGGTAGDQDSELRVYCMQKNMLRNALKNFGLPKVCEAGTLILFYTIFRMIRYLVLGQFRLVLQLIFGSFEPLMLIRGILQQRKKMQTRRVLSDRQLVSCGYVASLRLSVCEYARTALGICSQAASK